MKQVFLGGSGKSPDSGGCVYDTVIVEGNTLGHASAFLTETPEETEGCVFGASERECTNTKS
jgi:hypothetical protein